MVAASPISDINVVLLACNAILNIEHTGIQLNAIVCVCISIMTSKELPCYFCRWSAYYSAGSVFVHRI